MIKLPVLEEKLRSLPVEDLDRLVEAADVFCNKLPEQLILELGMRTLRDLVKLQISARKKGDGDGKG
jgi:hypothetical protein